MLYGCLGGVWGVYGLGVGGDGGGGRWGVRGETFSGWSVDLPVWCYPIEYGEDHEDLGTRDLPQLLTFFLVVIGWVHTDEERNIIK